MHNETFCIQQIPIDPLTGSISTPIYATSTFVQDAPGVNRGYDYSRTNNPTRKVLEDLMAQLEGGARSSAFASGLAAIDAVIKLLSAGDEVIAVNDIYGGAYRLFTHVYTKLGINFKYVDTADLSAIAEAINSKTKLIWLESPTNPTLKISDIQAISNVIKDKNILLCVDNTFASPVAQKPINLGADLVIHSATKYLGGHSDLIAGIVVSKTQELGEKIHFNQNASGGILGPFESWLVIRGIETLPLRIQQHSKSAQQIAEYLSQHPLVKNVYYPGLKQHKNHEIAKKQMSLFGGIISFDLVNDPSQQALQIVQSTKLFKLAESLGGAKSLLCLPSEMTHKSIPRETRYQSGITDSLIRLSVGLEHPEDLIADLDSALSIQL